MSAEYVNTTVGDKHHREITNLNTLATDAEAASLATDSYEGDSSYSIS